MLNAPLATPCNVPGMLTFFNRTHSSNVQLDDLLNFRATFVQLKSSFVSDVTSCRCALAECRVEYLVQRLPPGNHDCQVMVLTPHYCEYVYNELKVHKSNGAS